MLWARDAADARHIKDTGREISQVLQTKDLCGGEEIFFAATGVSDGRD